MDPNKADKAYNLKVWAILLWIVQTALIVCLGLAIGFAVTGADPFLRWGLVAGAVWMILAVGAKQVDVHDARIALQKEHEPLKADKDYLKVWAVILRVVQVLLFVGLGYAIFVSGTPNGIQGWVVPGILLAIPVVWGAQKDARIARQREHEPQNV